MAGKYHIHTAPAPPRFRPVGKLGIVDWREDCSSCKNCVKKGCVYGLYRDEYDALHDELGYLDYIYQCKGCLSCIQNCTKNLLTRVFNPEHRTIGDDYFSSEILMTTWYQAETGSIPVSGAGYRGPFSGPGFDSMWTDMSEIVRPTRDGIHGREYINTSVDIGRKLPHLSFQEGELAVSPPPVLENPLPLMLEIVPERFRRGPVTEAVTRAAKDTGLVSAVTLEDWMKIAPGARSRCIPVIGSADVEGIESLEEASIVMLPDSPDVLELRSKIKQKNQSQIVSIRIEASPAATRRIVQLVRDGAEVVHLVFDSHGMERSTTKPRHMRYVLREVHNALVKEGTRDEFTLVASGGVALAEHMAKAVICGADLVAVDLPLMVAMECRLCGECERGEACPIELEDIDIGYAVRRITNLMGTWHSQLLEMLGAMGLREVRRLRGEVGRCMFFEDLEADTFGRLFGQRKDQGGAVLK